MTSASGDNMIAYRLASALQEIFDKSNIDEGHNLDHALVVLNHTKEALSVSKTPTNPLHREAIKYAALLHDADDQKFFPESNDYQNARAILEQVLPGENLLHDLVIKMISLVSCSSNGNSRENVPEGEEWMLIPRYADRLEAIGPIGILRAWTYSEFVERPLFLPETERATTVDELFRIATKEKFEQYLVAKKSKSLIDHIYDKLLHIGTEEAILIDNSYIRGEARRRHNYIVDFALKFGRRGTVDRRVRNKVQVQSRANQ